MPPCGITKRVRRMAAHDGQVSEGVSSELKRGSRQEIATTLRSQDSFRSTRMGKHWVGSSVPGASFQMASPDLRTGA
jgi:hypothetical protein